MSSVLGRFERPLRGALARWGEPMVALSSVRASATGASWAGGAEYDEPVDDSNRLTTCGPSALVVARMINDPGYAHAMTADASSTRERFVAEVLALHRRTNRWLLARDARQLPWPRRLGTAPWSAATAMSVQCGVPGSTYRARWVDPRDPEPSFVAIAAAVGAGHCLPLYVGNAVYPGHVVLVIGTSASTLTIYNPAGGLLEAIDRTHFVARRLSVAGWNEAWFAVLPQTPSRHPVRVSRARRAMRPTYAAR